jgi:hypothetical protein
MKKIVFFWCIFGVYATIQAQHFYFRFAPGYAATFTKESSSIRNFTQHKLLQTDSTAASIDKANFTTLGGGLMLNGALGYRFSQSFLFELEAQYLYGNPVQGKGVIILDPEDFNRPDIKGAVQVDIRRYSRQVRIMPSITLRTPEFYGVLVPYIKMGLIVPVAGKSVTDVTQKFVIPTEMQTPVLGLQNDSTITLRYETKGKFGVGLNSAIGLAINTGNKMAVFAEVFHQSFAVKADHTTLVKYEENGKDRLSTKTPYETHTEYIDEISSTHNNATYNPSQFQNPVSGAYDITRPGYQKPKQELRPISQFSNIGINLGLRVYLK